MKKRILFYMPLLGIAIIVIYLGVKYDAINKGEVDEDTSEVAVPATKIVFAYKNNFEDLASMSFVPSDSVKFEGSRAALIAKDNLYGPTFELDSLGILQQAQKVEVAFSYYPKLLLRKSSVVLSIDDGTNGVVWLNAGFSAQQKLNDWNKGSFSFVVDASKINALKYAKLKVYVHNPEKEELVIDNFEVNLTAAQ
ncbi:MAG: hypothetical protein ACO3EE_05995 [Flavobacteriales bacterium]